MPATAAAAAAAKTPSAHLALLAAWLVAAAVSAGMVWRGLRQATSRRESRIPE